MVEGQRDKRNPGNGQREKGRREGGEGGRGGGVEGGRAAQGPHGPYPRGPTPTLLHSSGLGKYLMSISVKIRRKK